jgi:hypothetical protein
VACHGGAVTQPLPQLVPAAAAQPHAVRADGAKGVCILLVVPWPVIMKHDLQIDWHLSLPIPGAWGTFGDDLPPMRMPVLLTAVLVTRGWYPNRSGAGT